MATLRGRNPKNTVQELLKINASGLSSTLVTVESGDGTATPLQLSTTAIALNGVQWPTTGASAGKVLSVATGGTALEWVTPASGADNKDIEFINAVNMRITGMSNVTIGSLIPGSLGVNWTAGQFVVSETSGDVYTVQSDGSLTLTNAMPTDGFRIVNVTAGANSAAARNPGTYFFKRVSGSLTVSSQPYIGSNQISFLSSDGTSYFPLANIVGTMSSLTTTAKSSVVAAVNELNSGKQATLVSGTNIKTVGGTSVLGSGNISIPYDIAAPVFGKPAANEVVLRIRTQRAFTLDTFYGYAGTTATASSAVFTVSKNGSSIGNITFAVSTNASTTNVATTSFAVGDILTITAPASQNASLADIDFFLKGTA